MCRVIKGSHLERTFIKFNKTFISIFEFKFLLRKLKIIRFQRKV